MYKVISFYIPYWADFNKTVDMFRFNGFKVDDMCSATKNGRVVNLWIDENDFENSKLEDHVGYFIGEEN